MKRILVSWSSGKDSAWALHLLRQRADCELVGLLTTVTTEFDRVAMHGTRRLLLETQAEAIGLPLWVVPLQVAMAEAERKIPATAQKETPADLEFSFYSNKAKTFLDLASAILDARIAAAKGDHEQAIKQWEKAVEIEDGLYYGELPEWFYPVRESLGGALLLNGEAGRAETVSDRSRTAPPKPSVAVWTLESSGSSE